jgi:hypothetical protein
MRVVSCRHQEPDMGKKLDLFARASLSVGALVSAFVWALAIAKVIDLCGWR